MGVGIRVTRRVLRVGNPVNLFGLAIGVRAFTKSPLVRTQGPDVPVPLRTRVRALYRPGDVGG